MSTGSHLAKVLDLGVNQHNEENKMSSTWRISLSVVAKGTGLAPSHHHLPLVASGSAVQQSRITEEEKREPVCLPSVGQSQASFFAAGSEDRQELQSAGLLC